MAMTPPHSINNGIIIFIQHTPDDNVPYNFDGPLPAPVELVNLHNQICGNPLEADDKPLLDVNANHSLLGTGIPSQGQQTHPAPLNDTLSSSSTPLSLSTCRDPRAKPARRTLSRLVTKKYQLTASNSGPRRNKRTQEEIEESKNLAAAKKAEKTRKAAEMAENKSLKQAQKQARAAIKSACSTPSPRFKWSDEGSMEVLGYINSLKAKYNKTSKKRPGYLAWSLYVHKYSGPIKRDYITIRELGNKVIFWRYKALMTQYKVSLI
ncbi:hypothetical protein PCASD_25724 [Puccinia coronata f. sp. avenae]|uniref:Uncharacterized protein n=1 Tax=Puccinia coronata f. sp. avenae TaxID=200324 RepID=A0A2N5TJZ4_9BASI|nr:hypothetical protein PCASD_25724 [Puccinia coronata f. sp. avenae]